MGNDITTNGQADGRPPLALLALNPRRWTIDQARALVEAGGKSAIADAVSDIERAFDPVPVERDARSAWSKAMDERLRRLAVKIAPGMSPSQTQPWRDVMVDALSDLPAMVSLTAAKRAIHRPFQFLNEVEKAVREIAADVMLERKFAISRIENLRLDMPTQLALPPQEDGAPLSFDEIRRMPASIRSLGISTGFITQEQLDDVEAAERLERDAA